MAAPYSPVTVTNYNLNPPADDGSVTPENQLNWSKHKGKIGDPLKTAIESTQTNLTTAFAKLVGGGGVLPSSISYEVVAADQGKLIKMTGSGTTLTTPSASVVGSPFVFGFINLTGGDLILEGNGSQTVDGETSVVVPNLGGGQLWTDGANWFSSGQNWQESVSPPQGRLTLTTLVPVLAADVTAATSIFYTPYVGNKIALWNGTKFSTTTFAEVSQALSDNTKSPVAAAADSVYDVFGWLDGATFRATRGPAWTSATNRGTGAGTSELERVQGIPMNKVSISNGPAANRGIHLATIATDASAQLNMMFEPAAAAGGSANRLDVWNTYNRVEVASMMRPNDNSWTYNSATVRSANASDLNRVTFVRGLAEDMIHAETQQLCLVGTSDVVSAGIGYDATNALSGLIGHITAGGGSAVTALLRGKYSVNAAAGRHFFQVCESGDTSTVTFYGDNGAPTLFQTGLIVTGRF